MADWIKLFGERGNSAMDELNERTFILSVDDLTKALNGMEFATLYCKYRFVARPDLNNARTCDSVAEMIYGVVKNGKFQVQPGISIDDNYRKTIVSYGLQKEYKLN